MNAVWQFLLGMVIGGYFINRRVRHLVNACLASLIAILVKRVYHKKDADKLDTEISALAEETAPMPEPQVESTERKAKSDTVVFLNGQRIELTPELQEKISAAQKSES